MIDLKVDARYGGAFYPVPWGSALVLMRSHAGRLRSMHPLSGTRNHRAGYGPRQRSRVRSRRTFATLDVAQRADPKDGHCLRRGNPGMQISRVDSPLYRLHLIAFFDEHLHHAPQPGPTAIWAREFSRSTNRLRFPMPFMTGQINPSWTFPKLLTGSVSSPDVQPDLPNDQPTFLSSCVRQRVGGAMQRRWPAKL